MTIAARIVARIAATTLAALLAGAAPAAAQDGDPDIVVTGDPERDRQIGVFVRALTEAPANGQIARFEDAVCPAAFGLSARAREAVERRMRAVAAAVGLRLAAAGCRPNLLLMVTEDKVRLLSALLRRNPGWFGDERDNDFHAVANQPGRSSVWHAETVVNADGRALRRAGNSYVNQTTRQATRVAAAARPVFSAAAVAVEREALAGLSTTQLADYALMRALARTDPARLPASASSILTVLEAPDDREVPVTLTAWDLGFLRGLYAAPPNLYAPAQRGAIGRGVAAELARPEESGE